MKKWICLAVLCLMGVVLQAQEHVALNAKEVVKIMKSMNYTNHQHVRIYACSDLESVKEGDVVKVGIYFSIEEGWNIYDNNPEGHGYLPTRVEWNVPEGCKVEKVEWQKPVKLSEGMDKMGYFHGCFVVVTIRVEKLPKTAFEVVADCEWQMCDDRQCIHKKGTATVRIANEGTKKTEFYGILKKW